MEEEPVRIIRESTRNLLKLNRQVHKDELSDVRRSIETLSITPDSLEHIVNRLKTKSAVHVNELHALKNSILDNTKTIELVLSTHGAVRGLVRELSGSDVKRQCAAAGCCCNLALGDSKACLALAKAAGPYLVAALDNLSTELAVTSAWALGNMAGSGSRACSPLAAQGALARLAALLAGAGAEQADAAIYALVHFAYQMQDELSPEYVEKIVQALSKLEVTPASARLLSIVFCHESPPILPFSLLYKIMESLTVSTEKHINACKGEDICCEVVYLLRTLANLTVDKEYGDIVMKIVEDKQMGCIFKKLLLSENIFIKESLLWFLGNLYSFNINSEFFNGLVS